MIPRGTIIAALLALELAISGEAVVAVRSSQPVLSSTLLTDGRPASGPHLAEGGPPQFFDAGAHPALTVDIGYADLTILTGKSSRIDVSVSASKAYGIFRATAPITAREDGDSLRIATTAAPKWSMGDDRMVTVLVPADTRVTVLNAGDIKANGLRAEASLKSIGQGSITVDDYNAPTLHVASSDGPVSLHRSLRPGSTRAVTTASTARLCRCATAMSRAVAA